MKVCFILSEISLPEINSHTGGSGVFYSILASKLRDIGHDVFVCVFPDTGKDMEKIASKTQQKKEMDFCIYNLSSQDNISINYCCYNGETNSIEHGIAIADYINVFCQKNEIDVVECQDFYGISQFLDLQVPVLVRLHTNLTVISTVKGCEGWINDKIRRAENLSLIMADSVAGVSKFIIDDTQKNCFLGNDNLYGVIYNAIDYNKFQYASYTDKIKKRLIYVGSLNENKGIVRLLTLFNKVHDLDNSIELLLVGKGNLEHFIDVVTPQAKSAVTHIEHVSHDKISELISYSSMFILSSHHESFGLVIGEAMSIGRTVFIYSECSVFSELIEHKVDGIIWNNVSDINGAANEIVNLINDTNQMEQIGINARRKIEKMFGVNKLISETESWYKYAIDNLVTLRKKNNYYSKNHVRKLIIANAFRASSNVVDNNYIVISGNVEISTQVKQFIKQVLKIRGFNRNNIFSVIMLKKIVFYPFKMIKGLIYKKY